MARDAGDRGEPFGWWGHRSSPAQPYTIVDLLRNGNLDARIAAFFWLVIERRASLVVTSTLQDAGKTTLLTALLDFLPPEIERLYLRGWYERFDFIESKDPRKTYLLCNEISDNLPTYLWGPGVQRLFEVATLGYPLATTLHGDGAAAMADLMTAFPLEVPRSQLARIDFVLTLGGGSRSAGFLRRLMQVETISAAADAGLVIQSIAERDVLLGPLVTRPGQLIGLLTERFGLPRQEAITQLARREQFLEHLLHENAGSGAAEAPEHVEHVRNAIRHFARG